MADHRGVVEVLEEAYRQANFRGTRTRIVPLPLRLSSTTDCICFEREPFGALHQMLSELPEPERRAFWEEIEEEPRQFEGPDGFEGPCEMIAAVGVK